VFGEDLKSFSKPVEDLAVVKEPREGEHLGVDRGRAQAEVRSPKDETVIPEAGIR